MGMDVAHTPSPRSNFHCMKATVTSQSNLIEGEAALFATACTACTMLCESPIKSSMCCPSAPSKPDPYALLACDASSMRGPRRRAVLWKRYG